MGKKWRMYLVCHPRLDGYREDSASRCCSQRLPGNKTGGQGPEWVPVSLIDPEPLPTRTADLAASASAARTGSLLELMESLRRGIKSESQSRKLATYRRRPSRDFSSVMATMLHLLLNESTGPSALCGPSTPFPGRLPACPWGGTPASTFRGVFPEGLGCIDDGLASQLRTHRSHSIWNSDWVKGGKAAGRKKVALLLHICCDPDSDPGARARHGDTRPGSHLMSPTLPFCALPGVPLDLSEQGANTAIHLDTALGLWADACYGLAGVLQTLCRSLPRPRHFRVWPY